MGSTIETPIEVEKMYKHFLVYEYLEIIYNGDSIYIGVLDRKKDVAMCRDKAVVYIREKDNDEWKFMAILNTDAEHWSDDDAKGIVYEMIKLHYSTYKPLYLTYKKSKKT